jgi:hypothetical protein
MAVADYQLKLIVNSVDVGESRHLIQWSDVNTYYHTQNGYLLANVFVIPFCLDTTSVQPTGTLNFSRLDKFELVTPPTVPLRTMITGQYLYGVGYNILDIHNGNASLMYYD